MMIQLKSICNSPLKDQHSHPIHTCFPIISSKYQGVKEFHMLARIGCYCKIMVSVLLKLRSHIITHQSITNDGGPSNLSRLLKYTVKWL